MKTQSSKEGYLLIDHRASPGVDQETLRLAGIDMPACGEGQTLEMATLTCVHCGVVCLKNPDRMRDRGHCFKCNGYTCDPCVALGDCRPLKAVADIVCGTDKGLSPLSPLLLRR